MSGALRLSAEFLAALQASGRSRSDLAATVASSLGCAVGTVKNALRPGYRVAYSNGRNTIIEAVCAQLAFPYDGALTTVTVATVVDSPQVQHTSVESRFRAALAHIRAQRRRLTPEDCHARCGSPFGVPDDDEAA